MVASARSVGRPIRRRMGQPGQSALAPSHDNPSVRRLAEFYILQLRLLWQWRPGIRSLVRRIVVLLLVGVVALIVTTLIVPGVAIDNVPAATEALIVIAALNALVRPVLLALVAPFSVIALVITSLVLQVVIFYAVAALVPGFTVHGVPAVFAASALFALINTALGSVFAGQRDESYYGVLVRQLTVRQGDAVHTTTPGLVVIQIDGLSHDVLAHQVRSGRVPFLASWLQSGEMRLTAWEAMLPTQTSASQAGILHGNNDGIPAFRWWEKASGRLYVSNHPTDATEIERRVSNGEGLLSNGGASIGNLVSGDATRSYLTMATLSEPGKGLGRSQSFYGFFLSPYGYITALALTLAEAVKEIVQAQRAIRAGIEPRTNRGLPYPVVRAITNVLLRELSTSLVIEEMYRGTQVIYVDFTDYDEIAHHSGPERSEALDALDGLDRTVATIVHAADGTPRPYRFVVLSDHGQALGATFRERYGMTVEAMIRGHMTGANSMQAATKPAEDWGPVNALASELSQAHGATGAVARTTMKARTSDGVVDLGAPRKGTRSSSGSGPRSAGAAVPDLVVCASGNLAHVYLANKPGRLSAEDLDELHPGLVNAVVAHPGIGLVLVATKASGSIVLGATGSHRLRDDSVEGADPLAPFGPSAADSLRRLDGIANVGDLALISRVDSDTEEVAAFEELVGSHGGLGGAQTSPFILHPTEWQAADRLVGAPAVHQQLRSWIEGIGITLGSPHGH